MLSARIRLGSTPLCAPQFAGFWTQVSSPGSSKRVFQRDLRHSTDARVGRAVSPGCAGSRRSRQRTKLGPYRAGPEYPEYKFPWIYPLRACPTRSLTDPLDREFRISFDGGGSGVRGRADIDCIANCKRNPQRPGQAHRGAFVAGGSLHPPVVNPISPYCQGIAPKGTRPAAVPGSRHQEHAGALAREDPGRLPHEGFFAQPPLAGTKV